MSASLRSVVVDTPAHRFLCAIGRLCEKWQRCVTIDAEPHHGDLEENAQPSENALPRNWCIAKKVYVTALITFNTFSSYAGSSIVVPSVQGVQEEFRVTHTQSLLTVSLFVIGYGVGPTLFSPFSDHHLVGRSYPYLVGAFVLLLLNIGAARCQSFAALIILRFLAGIASSPVLAIGGASVADVWPEGIASPIAIAVWDTGAVCGPVLGPLLGSFEAMNNGWRSAYWVYAGLSGAGLFLVFFLLPETSESNVKYRHQIVKPTCLTQTPSKAEAVKEGVFTQLFLPLRFACHPVVAYSSLLMGLEYGIMYLAFEAVPVIFGEIYGFNLGQQSLVFVGQGVVTFFIALPTYVLFLVRLARPAIARPDFASEDWIKPSLVAAPLVLVSLLWTGWTASSTISFWSPLLAFSLYMWPIYALFLSVITYLSFIFHSRQIASVLAANVLIRSVVAAAFPLIAEPMFARLGIAKSYTLLAGLSFVLLCPLWALYKFGNRLHRSAH